MSHLYPFIIDNAIDISNKTWMILCDRQQCHNILSVTCSMIHFHYYYYYYFIYICSSSNRIIIIIIIIIIVFINNILINNSTKVIRGNYSCGKIPKPYYVRLSHEIIESFP